MVFVFATNAIILHVSILPIYFWELPKTICKIALTKGDIIIVTGTQIKHSVNMAMNLHYPIHVILKLEKDNVELVIENGIGGIVSQNNEPRPIEDALRAELAALKEATRIPAIPGYLPMESGDYRVLCREGISTAAYTLDYQWDDYPNEVIAWKPLEEAK